MKTTTEPSTATQSACPACDRLEAGLQPPQKKATASEADLELEDADHPTWNVTELSHCYVFSKSISSTEFRQSLRRRCDVCLLIYRGVLSCCPLLQPVSTFDKLEGDENSGEEGSHVPGISLVIRLRKTSNERIVNVVILDGDTHGTIELSANGADAASRSCLKGLPAAPWTSDTWASAVARAKAWLDECCQHHRRCSHSDPQPLPKRVIDVGDGTSQHPIRLVEPSTAAAATERYMTLSHCWGSTQHLTTTTATLRARKRGISLDEMPLTFRDAVLFTRALEIRYLWIDSLCILQDQLSDWEQEAAAMFDVYRHSYLNLAATAAADGTGGCLGHVFKEPLSVTHADHSHTAWVRVRPQHCPSFLAHGRLEGFRPASGVPEPSFEGTPLPLMTRGWVYQERMLPSRVLHFAEDELFWECSEGVDCECMFLREFFERQGADAAWVRKQPPKTLHELSLEGAAAADVIPLEKRWRQMVSEYTMLQLSHGSDRLHAIAGLAQQVGERRGGGAGYCFGLWKDSMAADMQWTRQDPVSVRGMGIEKHLEKRPRHPLAPSWSWGSIEGPVVYAPINDLAEHWVLQVLAAPGPDLMNEEPDDGNVTMFRVDGFGKDSERELRVTGCLFPVAGVIRSDQSYAMYQVEIAGPDSPLACFRPDAALSRRDSGGWPARKLWGFLLRLDTSTGKCSFLVLRRNRKLSRGALDTYSRVGWGTSILPNGKRLGDIDLNRPLPSNLEWVKQRVSLILV